MKEKNINISKAQIRDIYTTLKNLSDSYQNKESSQSDAAWISQQYQIYFPQLTTEEATQLGENTIAAIQQFDRTLKEVMDAATSGKNKEQWFYEKMKQELNEMELSEAGIYAHALDSALLQGNQCLINHDPVQIDEEHLTIYMPDDIEVIEESNPEDWNAFTVKDVIMHAGQNAILTGLQTVNQPDSFQFAADAIEDISDSAESLKKLIENRDTEQLKALLTTALKININNQHFPFLSTTVPIDTIANIASNGVEYISTLSMLSNGQLTMMQALEHTGLSGISLLYNLCSFQGIKTLNTVFLSQVPIVGPILGGIIGGIFSRTLEKKKHEKIKEIAHKVADKAKTVVRNTWEKVKSVGRSIGNKVRSVCSRISSIFH